jgi:endonuclease-3
VKEPATKASRSSRKHESAKGRKRTPYEPRARATVQRGARAGYEPGAQATGGRAEKSGPRPRPAASSAAPRAARKPRLLRETDAGRQARALRLLARLKETYPTATCALHHRDAYELLVATILSAQCTDVRVNMVTPDLFRRYPDARALADADPAELEAAIRSTGFFRNKTKSLLGMAKLVRGEYGGQIPDTMDGLLRLPGVARKTANCVLGTAFGKDEGIVVDTHVGRIAERLALAPSAKGSKDAEKIEQDLMKLFPRETWTWLSFALIDHGRAICTARKPKCGQCPLAADCPSAGKV